MSKKKKSKFGANVVTDVARRKKEGSAYGYLNLPQGITMFKEAEGKVHLDVIPYIVSSKKHLDYNSDNPASGAEEGEPWYKKPILVHRNVGVENDSLVCPKTIGKKCPVCEARDAHFKNGGDKEEAPSKAQLRNLYLVIPLDHKKFDDEIHLWDISNGNFQKVLDEELEENPDNGIFPDLVDGLTLKVRFSEETFAKNKYYEASRIDFEERDETYKEGMIDDSPDLDEIITVLSYDELNNKFQGLDEDDIGEEKEEKRPSRKKKKLREESEETPSHEYTYEDIQGMRKRGLKKLIDTEELDIDVELYDDVEGIKEAVCDELELSSPSAQVAREEAPEEKEEKPQRKSKRSNKSEEECPEGHSYAVDWDEEDDCDDCRLFNACGVAAVKLG